MGVYINLYAPILINFNMSTLTEKPRLYSRGQDQVLLDDYIKALNSGFDKWLNSIDVKDKYKKDIRTAYQDLLGRLNANDGTFISEGDGSFRDTTGKLSNATDSKIDAYGIAAYYLNNTLQNMSIYEEPVPEDKIIWGDTALQTAINKKLWGKGGENLQYFIDLDPYNEETKTRTQDNRIAEFSELLNDLETNFDSNFHGYSEDQKNQALSDITILKGLLEGGITSNEYYTLNKILGDGNYEQLFTTGTLKTSDTPQTQDSSIDQDFFKWLAQNGYENTVEEFDQTYSYTNPHQEAISKLDTILSNQTENNLYELIKYIAKGGDVNYAKPIFDGMGANYNMQNNFVMDKILHRLLALGKLSDVGNGYYHIKGLVGKNKSEVYFWDKTNKRIIRKNGLTLPNFRNDLISKYKSSIQGTPDYSQYFSTPSYKKGGVLKAEDGIKWSDDILSSIFYTDDDYQNSWQYDLSTGEWNPRTQKATNTKNPKSEEFDTTGNGNKIEDLDYWNTWVTLLTNNPELGLNWSRNFHKWRPEGSTIGNNLLNPDGTLNSEALSSSTLYNDGDEGPGHDIIRGRVYQNEQGKYINYLPEGYSLSNEDPILADNNLAYIYKIVKNTPKNNLENISEGGKKDSELNPVDVDNKENNPKSNLDLIKLQEIIPNTLAGTRAGLAIQHNNSLAEYLNSMISPNLQDTYTLDHPITGAFAQKQYYEQQGSNIRSQAGLGSTSDASLQKAGELDANMRASELDVKGNLIDNQEIQKNQALKRQYRDANTARWSKVVNDNRKVISDYKKELAQIEASRKQNNYQSINTLLSEIESRQRSNFDSLYSEYMQYVEAQDQAANSQLYKDEITQIQDAITDWKIKNPTGIMSQEPWYVEYSKRQRELAQRLANDNAISMGKRRGWQYTDLYKDDPYQPRLDWKNIIK